MTKPRGIDFGYIIEDEFSSIINSKLVRECMRRFLDDFPEKSLIQAKPKGPKLKSNTLMQKIHETIIVKS